jgi:anti-anti-sigma factor
LFNLKITISQEKINGRKIKIARLNGFADASNILEIDQKVKNILLRDNCDLILEGSKLKFINSTFIGELALWINLLKQKKCKVILVSFLPHVLDTLKAVGLLKSVLYFDDLAKARAVLAGV